MIRSLRTLLAIAALALGCSSGAEPGRGDAKAETPHADAAAGPPVCRLSFSLNTANLIEPDVPVAYSCPGERTDDGMGHPFIDFQPGDTQVGVVRTFSIWQFETGAPTGTVLKVEDGY